MSCGFESHGAHQVSGTFQLPAAPGWYRFGTVASVKGSRVARGPNTWQLRVYAGRDPGTGRGRTRTRTFHGPAKAADRALRAFIDEVETERFLSDQPFGALLDKWLEHTERLGRSPTTLREYRRLVERTIKPALGSVKLRNLTARHLDGLYGQLVDRGLAPASVHQVHSVCRRALVQAQRWQLVTRNVAEDATPPPLHPRDVGAPPVDAVQRLLQAAEAEDPEMATFIALAALTGARRGELCGLRWGDVDWDRRTLVIARAYVAVPGGGALKPTKTHGVRRVALDDVALEVLRRHRARAQMLADELGVDVTPESPLLSYDRQRPVNPDTATGYVGSLARRLGLDLHLHSLRHFAATEMIGAGTDVRTVAARLGHRDPSVTLRVYAHALPERDQAAAAVLGRALRPPGAKAPPPL